MPKKVAVKLSELKEYQERHFKLLLAQLSDATQKLIENYLKSSTHSKEETEEFKANIAEAQASLADKIAAAEKRDQKSVEEQALLTNPAARNLSHFYNATLNMNDAVPVVENLTIGFGLDGADLSGSIITNTYFKKPVNSTLNLSDCKIKNTKFETREYRNVGNKLWQGYELAVDFPEMDNAYVDPNCTAVSSGWTVTTNPLNEVMKRQGVTIFYRAEGPDVEERTVTEPEVTQQPTTNPSAPEVTPQPATKPAAKQEVAPQLTPKIADASPAVSQTLAKPSQSLAGQTLRVNSNLQDLEDYAEKHRKFLKEHGGLTREELAKMDQLENQWRSYSDEDIAFLKDCYSKAYKNVRDQEARFSEEVRNSPEFSSRGSYAEYLAIEGKTGPVQPFFEDFTNGDAIDANLTGADLTGTTFKNCRIIGQINATTILAGASLENTEVPYPGKLDYETPAPKTREEVVKTRNNLVDVETLIVYAKLHSEYLRLSYVDQKALAQDSPLYKARASLAEYAGLEKGAEVTLVAKDGQKPIIKDCDLSNADLSRVNFNHAYFENVICKDTNFANANLNAAYFNNCKFQGTSFKESTLTSATLDRCSLDRKTSLDHTKVDGLYVIQSDIDASLASVVAPADKSPFRVKESSVSLSSPYVNVTLENTAIYPSAELVDQYVAHVAETGKDSKNFVEFLSVNSDCDIVIKDYDFSGKDFTNTKFAGVTFKNVKFKDVNFSGANLTNCLMENCNLKRATFNEANLTGARLNECKLVNANFENTEMLEVKVNGYQEDSATKLAENTEIFKGAKNFSSANLEGEFPDELRATYQPLTMYNQGEKVVAAAKVIAAAGVEAMTKPQNAAYLAMGVATAIVIAPVVGPTVACLAVVAGAGPGLKTTAEYAEPPLKELAAANTKTDHQKALETANEATKRSTRKIKHRIDLLKPSMDKVMITLGVAAAVLFGASTMGIGLGICLAAGGVAAAASYLGYSAIREKVLTAKEFIVEKVKKLFSNEKPETEVAIALVKAVDVKTADKQPTAKAKKDTPEVLQSATPVIIGKSTQPEPVRTVDMQHTTHAIAVSETAADKQQASHATAEPTATAQLARNTTETGYEPISGNLTPSTTPSVTLPVAQQSRSKS